MVSYLGVVSSSGYMTYAVETWDGLQTGEYVGERGYGGGDSVRRTGGC